MKFSTIFTAISVFAVGLSEGSPLRDTNFNKNDKISEENNGSRKLFFSTSVTFADIIADLSPALETAIRTTLAASLDPTNPEASLTQEFDVVSFGNGCESSATVTAELGSLTGLGNFDLQSLDLVDGSQTFDFSFRNGASFSGTFIARAAFPDGLEAIGDAQIAADACGETIQQSASGFVDAVAPALVIEFNITGSTPGFFSFSSPSIEAMSAARVDLKVGDAVETNIGFGNDIDFDPTSIFTTLLDSAITDALEPLILAVLNSSLSGGFTF